MYAIKHRNDFYGHTQNHFLHVTYCGCHSDFDVHANASFHYKLDG